MVEVIRGVVPVELEVSGNGSGYGYWYGSGSGDGSGYGSWYGSWYGSGSGDGCGDGSGYGSGDGSGYGSGDGSGYGSGDGDSALLAVARSTLTAAMQRDARILGLWKSGDDGRPANGGVELRAAYPGLKQEAPGPLELCTANCLHATLKPSKWKGDRLWIVALEGEVVGNEEKMGALKREILAEVKF